MSLLWLQLTLVLLLLPIAHSRVRTTGERKRKAVSAGDFLQADFFSAHCDELHTFKQQPFYSGDLRVIPEGKVFSSGIQHRRTCFLLKVLDEDDLPFDDRCNQRAFLEVTISSSYLELDSEETRGEESGTPLPKDVQHTPFVTYDPSNSKHRVCYQLPFPGSYDVSVFLTFTNAARVMTTLDPQNVDGYVGKKLVASWTLKIAVDNSERHRRWKQQPMCSLPELFASRDHGSWEGPHTWRPSSCVPHRITPQGLARCLHGKRILFLGDSEIRYTLSLFVFFLACRSRCHFMNAGRRNYTWVPDFLASLPRPVDVVEPAIDPITGRSRFTRVTMPGSLGTGVYYGHYWNGFTSLQIRIPREAEEEGGESDREERKLSGDLVDSEPVPIASETSGGAEQVEGDSREEERGSGEEKVEEEEKGDTATGQARAGGAGGGGFWHFNVTYAVHLRTSPVVFQSWMLDPKSTGGAASVFDGQPFDMACIGTTLHDIISFSSLSAYRDAISSQFLPSLREFMSEDAPITFFGPWAAQEDQKARKFIYKSNNVRGTAFETVAMRALEGEKNVAWVSTHAMTLGRPDLCVDSTHYSWPVIVAGLEMWLGSICKPSHTNEEYC